MNYKAFSDAMRVARDIRMHIAFGHQRELLILVQVRGQHRAGRHVEHRHL